MKQPTNNQINELKAQLHALNKVDEYDPKISEKITQFLVDRGHKVYFSSLSEVVCSYLSDYEGTSLQELDYRYKMAPYQAQELMRDLELFKFCVGGYK